MNLKLSEWGMILLCVPIVFELGFLGCLLWVVYDGKEHMAQSNRADKIVTECSFLRSSIQNAGFFVGGYAMSQKNEMLKTRYVKFVKEAQERFVKLKVLLAGQDYALKKLGEIQVEWKDLYSGMVTIADAVERPGYNMPPEECILVFTKFEDAIRNMDQSFEDLLALYLKPAGEKEQLLNQQTTATVFWLIFFTALGSVGSLVFSRWFYSHISRRLGILMDNTERLARHQPLQAPLGGFDEIAAVDTSFHSMAQALTAALNRETAVVENVLDVICKIDNRGKFASVNPAAELLWGYAPEELIGRELLFLLPGEDWQTNKQAFQSVRLGNPTMSLENRVIRKDGSLVDMAWSVSWSEDEQGLFCVAKDITERRELERLKQEFVAMISHDLRSPLTSIQLTLNMLNEGVFGDLHPKGKSRVSNAEESATMLIKLISDLLDMEKLESGKFQLELDDTQLSEVLRRAVEAVRPQADEKQVTIKVEHANERVFADADRLVQVLTNLLSNAVKFSPDKGTVNVGTADAKDQVEVRVADQGRGIPDDQLERVFERFTQVSVSDAKEKKGTGLGLPICKAIVESHGGAIGVTSVLGQGSTFWFRIKKHG